MTYIYVCWRVAGLIAPRIRDEAQQSIVLARLQHAKAQLHRVFVGPRLPITARVEARAHDA